MNKTEFISSISSKLDGQVTKKDIDLVVKAYQDVIIEAMAGGDSVQLLGFATFKASQRKERTGKNPLTGEQIKIAACNVPSAKFSPAVKKALNPEPKAKKGAKKK